MPLEMIDQRDRKQSWLSRSIDELVKTAEEKEQRALYTYKERVGFGQYRIKLFSHHPINRFRFLRPLYVINGATRRDLFQTEEPIKAIPVGTK